LVVLNTTLCSIGIANVLLRLFLINQAGAFMYPMAVYKTKE